MSNEEYRIEFDSSNTNEDLPASLGEDLPPPPSVVSPVTRPTAGPTDVHSSDHLHQVIQFVKDNATSTFPFALILILKAFYEHSAGILMVIFFSASIYHANSVLVHQVSLKASREPFAVLRVLFILFSSLVLFLYLFRREEFSNALIFARPNYEHWDLWTLLWVLYATFCLVKMLVMMVKGLLILYPLSSEKSRYCLRSRPRGSYLALIEYLSQFYLTLLTIRPWIHFLLDHREEKPFFSSFLLLFYSIVKLYNLFQSFRSLVVSLREARQSLPFPNASLNEVRENLCPICQSEFINPILLTCKHVFCEECVSSWLDRNASCPLCRCQLPIGKTNYRDGFTSGFLIWY